MWFINLLCKDIPLALPPKDKTMKYLGNPQYQKLKKVSRAFWAFFLLVKLSPLVAKIGSPSQKGPLNLNYPWRYADKYEVGGLISIFQQSISVHFLVFWGPGEFLLKNETGGPPLLLPKVTLSTFFYSRVSLSSNLRRFALLCVPLIAKQSLIWSGNQYISFDEGRGQGQHKMYFNKPSFKNDIGDWYLRSLINQ